MATASSKSRMTASTARVRAFSTRRAWLPGANRKRNLNWPPHFVCTRRSSHSRSCSSPEEQGTAWVHMRDSGARPLTISPVWRGRGWSSGPRKCVGRTINKQGHRRTRSVRLARDAWIVRQLIAMTVPARPVRSSARDNPLSSCPAADRSGPCSGAVTMHENRTLMRSGRSKRPLLGLERSSR